MRNDKEFFTKKIKETLDQMKQKQAKFDLKIDPFQEALTNLSKLYDYIKENILTSGLENLNNVAHHYFSVEGKLFRPIMNMLIAKLLYDLDRKNLNQDFYRTEIFSKQKVWGSVIEILHIASLIHDDILDNATNRRGLVTAHEKFGKSEATYGGNYLIGRAGRKIAGFNNLQIFEIYSMIMDNLTAGEYVQARKNRDFRNMAQLLTDYMIKSYYKTASLMAHSCRGVCLLNGGTLETQEKCFRIGQHLGIAFQLIDDVLDFTSSTEDLGKDSLSDVKEGHLNGPVLFAIQELKIFKEEELYQRITSILSKKHLSSSELKEVNQFIAKSTGIEKTRYLAMLHAKKALGYGEELIKDEISSGFAGIAILAMKAVTRKK